MSRLVSPWKFTLTGPDENDSYWERSVGPLTIFVDEQKPGEAQGWVVGHCSGVISELIVKARSTAEAKRKVRNRLRRYLMRMISGISK